MNTFYYYDKLIINPIEQEIKLTKKKLNKKFNFNKKRDLEYLNYLKKKLNFYYKKYYLLKNR